MSREMALALTMGEPAGIGGDITLMAWLRSRHPDAGVPPFFVIDDPARLSVLAERLGLKVPIAAISEPEAAAEAWASALPVLPQSLRVAVAPGRPEPANTSSVLGAIERAVALARAGRALAVVTNPIHKKVLYDGGFRHPGHTEYLAALAGTGEEPAMMLVGGGLRVVPVTGHVSLRDALAALSRAGILAKGRIAAGALARDFGIAKPRLAVAALNPHAGEEGALGREEIEIIAPAIGDLRRAGIDASGPVVADTLFHAEARARFDAVICMYHDQALIPVKTLDFAGGVNVTLGLPFVRTSPDHGTAFDLAGTGRASAASLLAALALAGELADRRAAVRQP
ncbi:MAG: 4-hydroxythreonine-4-phosphate dehydrogenase PdxA [Pseudomonadota bacterium]